MRKKNSLRIIYFNDAALTWLRNLMPQLKESTTSKYVNILNHYFIPAFGGKRIDRITYAEVYSFSMNLLSNGGMHKKGLSAKTINGIISVKIQNKGHEKLNKRLLIEQAEQDP